MRHLLSHTLFEAKGSRYDKKLCEDLLTASIQGYTDEVKQLIKDKRVNIDYVSKINYTDKHDYYVQAFTTPLLYASTHRHWDIVEMLIKAGANVNSTDKYKSTPLMYASDQLYIVKLLIEHGAKIDVQNIRDITALMLTKIPEIAILLIESGADMTIKNSDGDDFISDSNPPIFMWLQTEDAQRMILSKEPLLISSFKKQGIKIHPFIAKEFAHLLCGKELNLL